jgi:hypothetical protein
MYYYKSTTISYHIRSKLKFNLSPGHISDKKISPTRTRQPTRKEDEHRSFMLALSFFACHLLSLLNLIELMKKSDGQIIALGRYAWRTLLRVWHLENGKCSYQKK